MKKRMERLATKCPVVKSVSSLLFRQMLDSTQKTHPSKQKRGSIGAWNIHPQTDNNLSIRNQISWSDSGQLTHVIKGEWRLLYSFFNRGHFLVSKLMEKFWSTRKLSVKRVSRNTFWPTTVQVDLFFPLRERRLSLFPLPYFLSFFTNNHTGWKSRSNDEGKKSVKGRMLV